MKVARIILSGIRIFAALVLLLVIFATCWQQLSPRAARCTLVGGKYYVISGCIPAPVFVLPLNVGGGEQ